MTSNTDWEKLRKALENIEWNDGGFVIDDLEVYIRTQISLAEKRGAEKAVEIIRDRKKELLAQTRNQNGHPFPRHLRKLSEYQLLKNKASELQNVISLVRESLLEQARNL